MQKNLGGLLKSITELQKRMETIQRELADAVYPGDAAQGLVKVEMTGKGEIKSLNIDPSVLQEDAETVADLVRVACNKAFEAKEAAAKAKLASVSSGLLPMGLKIPGMA